MTTDTGATDDNHVDTADEELMPELWVEKATKLIYECKFFDGFILVRPATPAIYLAIKKVSEQTFMDDFEEFCGDCETVREFIRNAPPEFIIN